jgi:hypothetical protein
MKIQKKNRSKVFSKFLKIWKHSYNNEIKIKNYCESKQLKFEKLIFTQLKKGLSYARLIKYMEQRRNLNLKHHAYESLQVYMDRKRELKSCQEIIEESQCRSTMEKVILGFKYNLVIVKNSSLIVSFLLYI